MRKFLTLVLSLLIFAVSNAATLDGTVIDKTTKEPLPGAVVIITGTTDGAMTDFDGNFFLPNVPSEQVSITCSYVGYIPFSLENYSISNGALIIELDPNLEELGEVRVVARKVLSSMASLNNERIASTASIENIGAQEMSVKGISSAEDGVKKMTGITFSSGQLFVRGLSDRYSTTSLNGLPIASPNPDNKIIPLDLFPSSVISNITVSKVFQASSFADYAGAHINIDTRENVSEDFFKIGVSLGGQFTALTNDFYKSDIAGMFKTEKVSSDVKSMSKSEFDSYVKSGDVFSAGFNIKKIPSLPDLGLSLSAGKTFEIGEDDEFNVLLSGSIDNGYSSSLDAFTSVVNRQGDVKSAFDYDSYSQTLETSALLGLGYNFGQNHNINYNLFYTRSAEDNYKRREGYTYEGVNIISSNSVFKSYALLNNQLSGDHTLTDRWSLKWNGSYAMTSSDEPDRKQTLFEVNEDGSLSTYAQNAQDNMRFFADLSENELVGDVRFKFDINEESDLGFGATYKTKKRDYYSTRFDYNFKKSFDVRNEYSSDDYITFDNIKNGNVQVRKNAPPSNNYFAGTDVAAAYVDYNHIFADIFTVGVGLRYEKSNQWVKYSSTDDPGNVKYREIDNSDLFPGLNLKYDLDESQALRFSFSRTVTRPSFIEMAPFEYKESYGSQTLKGNENLVNGYNYNFDIRYEIFSENTKDMFSVTAYYKQLQTPIERVQSSQGDDYITSFQNVPKGMAAGMEVEFKRSITDEIGIGFNASYMYTDVNLGENNGGSDTEQNRALQGASPYLINADLIYQPHIRGEQNLSMSLLYNFEAERIDAVGVAGMSHVMQSPVHNMRFVANYKINERFDVNLKVNNLLNFEQKYTQDIMDKDDNFIREMVVARERNGINFSVGASMKF